MRKYLIQKLLTRGLSLMILVLALLTTAQAARVWQDTDIDLATLLEYDFRVIGTNFNLMGDGKQSVEVIYLGKEKKLFRCFTFEVQGAEPKHWCETAR